MVYMTDQALCRRVRAKHGIVTLSGHVSSYSTMLHAESTTRHVRGVRSLIRRTKVRPATMIKGLHVRAAVVDETNGHASDRAFNVGEPASVGQQANRSDSRNPSSSEGDRTMYRNIMVPYDGSATSERGLDEAIRLARHYDSQLRIVHVIDAVSIAFAIDSYFSDVVDWQTRLREAASRLVSRAEATARAAGVRVSATVIDLQEGSVGEIIARYADLMAMNLVVLGSHGRRGVGRAVLGSGAESIARLCKVPVLLVHPKPVEPMPTAFGESRTSPSSSA